MALEDVRKVAVGGHLGHVLDCVGDVGVALLNVSGVVNRLCDNERGEGSEDEKGEERILVEANVTWFARVSTC